MNEEKINKKSVWDKFTNMYPLSKTIRFELKPLGRTLENIKNKKLITQDEKRENDFNKIKKIMDEYYKEFIETSLSNVHIDLNYLNNYQSIYNDLKKDSKNLQLKKELENIQKILRKEVSKEIKKVDNFNKIFGEKLVKELLPIWLKKKERLDDLELVRDFSKWTTYFKGFFENRKNIFSEKEIPTSIIYRIVHDNLPKYLDNISKVNDLYDLENFNFVELEENFKIELNGLKINEFFSLTNFNNLLNQSGIELVNLIIGGSFKENKVKIKGLNEYINEHSQKEEDKLKRKNIRKLKLVILFKQILSDRNSTSFILEPFENDKDVFDNISKFYGKLSEENVFENIQKLMSNLKDNSLDQIYIRNDSNLTRISQDLFSNWNKIKELLIEYSENILKTNKKETESYIKKKYYSIKEIDDILNEMIPDENKSLCGYFSKLIKGDVNLIEEIKKNFKEYLSIDQNKNKLLSESAEPDIKKIKEFLDSIQSLYHFLKSLNLNLKKEDDEKGQDVFETDSNFYNDFNELFDKLGQIITLYNKVRNYVTKKPFSTSKFKLNFENSTLLAGWDVNKESDNWSILLKKENNFYLGIMSKENNKLFKNNPISEGENYFEKIDYKLLPGPNKMLPKVFFSKKNINYYNPSDEIINIRNTSSHTKHGEPQSGFNKSDFKIDDCHKMIDFFKISLDKHPEWNIFNFTFKKTEDYCDLSEFYKDISDNSYSITYTKVDDNYISKLVDDGKLYLFQIWNKDFSTHSKGKKNLHTIYWNELFSENNLKDVVYKLNGEAEIFFRKASIPRKITHKKNEPIENKNPIKDKKIGALKKESIFEYDIIKDKRYTEDKFLFHCPITMNFKAKDKSKIVSKIVNEYINKCDEEIYVLGIDRGERNLAYYTLIDSKGNLVEQKSFNIISDDLQRKLDYQEKLDEIEGTRDEARKNWKKISNIKEMKEGYLSQVIHNISKIAIEKNAIIVLEDLNFGFKRGRFKIEKQIYQKFEKMLIDKLNYLIFKDRSNDEIGGSLNAFQLTNKFESFKKLGKQTGIIYYVDAYKTSKICPSTGFVNLLYPKFENINKSKLFFNKFKNIKYNSTEDLFEFNFNYSDFSEDKKSIYHNLSKDNWSIWSNGIKLINKRNKDNNNNWETNKLDITAEIKKLFDFSNIVFNDGSDLKESICKQDKKDFFEKLYSLLRNILQLRNSYSDFEVKKFKKDLGKDFKESDYDYILSCVKDKNGMFFDSRNSTDNEIRDADANGAYHIALKGLMVINKIKETNLFVNKKVDLIIKRNDFINYIIERNE